MSKRLKDPWGDEHEVEEVREEGELLGYVAVEERRGPGHTFWHSWRKTGSYIDSAYAQNRRSEAVWLLKREKERIKRAAETRALRKQYSHLVRPRDSQRSKLYAAEQEAFADFALNKDRDLDAIKRYAAFVCEQVGRKGFFDFRPGSRPAYFGRGNDRGYIRLCRWGRTRDWVVIHELCHAWTPREFAGHGREYCATYLATVRKVLGRTWADKLEAAFKKHRVKYKPVRKRQLTDQQRDELRARLAKARAAKAAKRG